jgi:hypothetical protein
MIGAEALGKVLAAPSMVEHSAVSIPLGGQTPFQQCSGTVRRPANLHDFAWQADCVAQAIEISQAVPRNEASRGAGGVLRRIHELSKR